MSVCDDLAKQLDAVTRQLNADQSALNFANVNLSLALANVANDGDPNTPNPLNPNTAGAYAATLTGMNPPSPLLPLYWALMGCYANVGGLTVAVADDQASIDNIKAQQKLNNC